MAYETMQIQSEFLFRPRDSRRDSTLTDIDCIRRATQRRRLCERVADIAAEEPALAKSAEKVRICGITLYRHFVTGRLSPTCCDVSFCPACYGRFHRKR